MRVARKRVSRGTFLLCCLFSRGGVAGAVGDAGRLAGIIDEAEIRLSPRWLTDPVTARLCESGMPARLESNA